MCKDCIHEKVCLHKANIQNDTYAYTGVHYDTKKCKFFKNTAEVAEVKHGYWIEDYNYGWWQYTCSLCGADYHNTSPVGEDEQYGYCFDCGAKMDGERKENDSN